MGVITDLKRLRRKRSGRADDIIGRTAKRFVVVVGQTISHYRIIEKLGEGGMGIVYKAEDTKLRRSVALKFLPQHSIENRERFLREAQAAAALNHPNICTVFEIDEDRSFLAMELIDGISLKDKITQRPLPLEEALNIATQACAGLQAAHEKGIVHRDIKPANLMLSAQAKVKIMDFGLAQVGDRTRLPQPGISLGTPGYMSPEQAKGDSTDRRSDIWPIGVVLYEMVTGRLPFDGCAIDSLVTNSVRVPTGSATFADLCSARSAQTERPYRVSAPYLNQK